MRIKHIGIIFGPNGSGKGTLAEKLSRKFDYSYLNMGQSIRDWIASNLKERTEFRKSVNKGDLIGDALVKEILDAKFEKILSDKDKNNDKIIFDGIPRRDSQIHMIKNVAVNYGYRVGWIIVLNVPLEVILKRVVDRVTTPDGRVFHLKYNPPPASIDPKVLKKRKDDRPAIVEKRYEEYSVNTLECLSNRYFKDVEMLNIDATKSIDEVYEEAKEFVEKFV